MLVGMREPKHLVCGCGGDPDEPEHGLSARHYGYTVRLAQSEEHFQAAIITAARLLGWTVYHTYDSRRSNPGFPDLVLVKDRVKFREVKRQGGKLTEDQVDWLERLTAAGADAGVWRPADWDVIMVELEG